METNTKKMVALTFDDGPSETTLEVLDILEKYGIKATFFLIGELITEQTIPIMKRELEMGCEIENHSFTHSDMTKLSASEIREEIKKTSDAIQNAVGVQPKFFRPPYILTNDMMFENIDLNFIVGLGCNDWIAEASAQERTKLLFDNVKDGTMVLLHDFQGNVNTLEALPVMIEGLQDQGYTFVTVEELFRAKGINPEQRGKMWTNVYE